MYHFEKYEKALLFYFTVKFCQCQKKTNMYFNLKEIHIINVNMCNKRKHQLQYGNYG